MTKPERRAFYETLIADYSESVFRFLYRSLGNWHDAEDLTNEVFENAWRGLDQLQKPESAKAWLFAICRNRMRTKLQRRKKAAPLETINESDLPVDRGDEVEHRDTIQFAASHLDSQTLEVVLLVVGGLLGYLFISAFLFDDGVTTCKFFA